LCLNINTATIPSLNGIDSVSALAEGGVGGLEDVMTNNRSAHLAEIILQRFYSIFTAYDISNKLQNIYMIGTFVKVNTTEQCFYF